MSEWSETSVDESAVIGKIIGDGGGGRWQRAGVFIEACDRQLAVWSGDMFSLTTSPCA